MVFSIGHVRLSALHLTTLVHERTIAAQIPVVELFTVLLRHSQSTLLEHEAVLQTIGLHADVSE